MVIIHDSQLVWGSIHQEKARQLSSFLKGVPADMVDNCGHAFFLIAVV